MENSEDLVKTRLFQVFGWLAAHFGPLHWWPAETPFEVVVGAILTQNTAWSNVERAISQLKEAGVLTPGGIRGIDRVDLEKLVRPAGFFRQKAERLQLLVEHLFTSHQGDLGAMLSGPVAAVRKELLALKGVGPETADSILLYAGDRPSFVVDAYTRRLFTRLGLLSGRETYEDIRSLFMDSLSPETDLFNEYHALIVEECKTFCRKRQPLCQECPLLDLCPFGQERQGR
jgi:endonuclease-3 related protein